MRTGDDIVQLEQRMILGQRLMLIGIQTRRRDLAGRQRVNHRRFIDNRDRARC